MEPTSSNADTSAASSSGPKAKPTFKENKVLYIKTMFIGFLKMIYNPKKRRFLGKDGEDWLYLSLFYIVFYLAIGLFSWGIMAVFMGINKATNPDRPRYTGKLSVLQESVFSPGMGVRPHFSSTAASISISADSAKYVDYMKQFFQPYHQSLNNTKICNSSLTQAPANTACRHPIFEYLEALNCDEKQNFGYTTGLPCVFIKINNLFDWKPTGVMLPSNSTFTYAECNNTNTEVLSKIKDPMVYVTCNGVGGGDNANINSMTFNSVLGEQRCVAGVPFYFYPFNNVKNYMQPVIPLRLNLSRGASVAIECRAWAKSLEQDVKKGYGYVRFTVSVS